MNKSTEFEAKKDVRSLRIGDVIYLQMERVSTKGVDEETGQKMLFFYKGILGSDGVCCNCLFTIPMKVNQMKNESFSFKQCLFRVENARQYKQRIISPADLIQQTLYTHVDEEDAKFYSLKERIKAGGAEEEENKEPNLEEDETEVEFKMYLGNVISYGEKIQLRHLLSGYMLTVGNNVFSQEHGCLEVNLTTGNEFSLFKVLPSGFKQEGERVYYSDRFLLQNTNQSTEYFIHASSVLIPSKQLGVNRFPGPFNRVLEVNASETGTNWKAHLFTSYEQMTKAVEKEKRDAICSGDIVRLYHNSVGGYLCVSGKVGRNITPSQVTQIQSLEGLSSQTEGRKSIKKVPEYKTMDGILQSYFEIDVFVSGAPHNLLNSYWEFETINKVEGGPAGWGKEYRLRHVNTGLYLCCSDAGRIILSTIDEAETKFCIHPIFVQEKDYIQNKSKIRIGKSTSKGFVSTHTDELANKVPVIWSMEKNLESNTIFTIREVANAYSKVGLLGHSLFTFIKSFFEEWSTETSSAIHLMFVKFVSKKDVRYDRVLQQSINKLMEMTDQLLALLKSAHNEGKLRDVQSILSQHNLLDIIFLILDMIDKQAIQHPQKVLEFSFLGQRFYKLIYHLINENPEVSIKIIIYDIFLAKHFARNKKIIQKIFQNILKSVESIESSPVLRWCNQLKLINTTKGQSNIEEQICYINLLSMVSKDQHDKPVLKFQIESLREIFDKKIITLEFGTKLTKGQDSKGFSPYFTFPSQLIHDTSAFNELMTKNPLLEKHMSNLSSDDSTPIFLLEDLTQNKEETYKIIEYVTSVINYYASICVGNNMGAQFIHKQGFTFAHIAHCLRNQNIHPKFKEAYITTCKGMLLEQFTSVVQNKNRFIQWDLDDTHQPLEFFYKNLETFRELTQNNELKQIMQYMEDSTQFDPFEVPGIDVSIRDDGEGNMTRRINLNEANLKLLLNRMIISLTYSLFLLEFGTVNDRFLSRCLHSITCVVLSAIDSDTSLPLNLSSFRTLDRSWLINVLSQSKERMGCKGLFRHIEKLSLKALSIILIINQNIQVYGFVIDYKTSRTQNVKIKTLYEQEGDLHDVLNFKENMSSSNLFIPKNLKIEITIDNFLIINEIEDPDDNWEGQTVPFAFYLLNYILSKNKHGDEEFQKDASSILISHFSQKNDFIQEIAKVDLIKSKEDIDIFEGMKKLYFRILDLKDKYKENMDQLTEVIEEISNALRIIHNNSITKFQNIIKHTKIHEELIELMKHINCETYAPLFTLIKKVLYKFIYRNPANQALLLPHLKLLLNLCEKGIDCSRLLIEILRHIENVSYKRTIINDVIKLLNTSDEESKNKLTTPDLLIILINLIKNTSDKINQVCVAKNVVALDDIKSCIMFDEEGRKTKRKLIRKISLKKSRKAKQKLDTHLYLIELLATTATDCEFGITQNKKLIPLDELLTSLITDADVLPFSFKRSYFRMLFLTHISKTQFEINVLFETFQSVILKDLENFKAFGLKAPKCSGIMKMKNKKGLLSPSVYFKLEKENDKKKKKKKGSKMKIEENGDDNGFEDKDEEKVDLVKNKNRNNEYEFKENTDYEDDSDEESNLTTEGKDYISSGVQATSRSKVSMINNESNDSEDSQTKIKGKQFNKEYWDYLTSERKWNSGRDGLLHFLAKLMVVISKRNYELSHEFIVLLEKIRMGLVHMEQWILQYDIPSITFLEDVVYMIHTVLEVFPMCEKNKYNNEEVLAYRNINPVPNPINTLIEEYIFHNKLTINQGFRLFERDNDETVDILEFKKGIQFISEEKYSFREIEACFCQMNEKYATLPGLHINQFAKSLKRIQVITETNENETRLDDVLFSFNINQYFKDLILQIVQRSQETEEEIDEYFIQNIKKALSTTKKSKLDKFVKTMKNALKIHQNPENQLYFMVIFVKILDDLREDEKVLKLNEVQNVLDDNGIKKMTMNIISKSKERALVSKAVELLISLLENNNKTRESLLDDLEVDKNTIIFFGSIRDHVNIGLSSINRIGIKKQRELCVDEDQCDVDIVNLEEIMLQPKKVCEINLMTMLLKLLQVFCDNCFERFQNFLRKQGEYSSVNLIYEISMLLVYLQVLRDDLFSVLYEETKDALMQLFETLIDFTLGTSEHNKKLFGAWPRFLKALNCFLHIVDKVDFNSTDEKENFKMAIFCKGSLFLLTLISKKTVVSIGQNLFNKINFDFLKSMMTEIYKKKLKYRLAQFFRGFICHHQEDDSKKHKNYECTEFSCDLGYITENDKAIIEGGFNLFILLTQIRAAFPNHPTLKDFAIEFTRKIQVTEKIKRLENGKRFSSNNKQPKGCKKKIELSINAEALFFYASNSAKVEVEHEDKIEEIMFPIPPYCRYLTAKTIQDIMQKANRENQQAKLDDFNSKLDLYRSEMLHQQGLHRNNRILKYLASKHESFARLSFLLIFAMNFLMLIFYHLEDGKISSKFEGLPVEEIFWVIKVVQICFAILINVGYTIASYPILYLKVKPISSIDGLHRKLQIMKGSLVPLHGKQSLRQIYEQKLKKRAFQCKDLVYLFFDFNFNTNLLYMIITFIAMFFNTLFYSLLLLDIIYRWDVLRGVLMAIYSTHKPLGQTLMLAICATYIFSVFAFINFRHFYIENPYALYSYCDSLISCFVSTLNNGFRSGGGIGDTLDQAYYETDDYYPRFFFDFSFFVVIIILMMNFVFGIIIDAFAEMRNKKKEISEDIEQRCFICGLSRFEFETKGNGWGAHVASEHNVYAYIYFLMYVLDKPNCDCTAIEKYVQECIDNNITSFYPIEKALALQHLEENEKEEDPVSTKIEEISKNINQFRSSIDTQMKEILLVLDNVGLLKNNGSHMKPRRRDTSPESAPKTWEAPKHERNISGNTDLNHLEVAERLEIRSIPTTFQTIFESPNGEKINDFL